ncbi:MAG: PAS domain-containing protein [Chloroflexi bacterium]|nr:PAS domain-containing protein [Chloroflexota bacterium]
MLLTPTLSDSEATFAAIFDSSPNLMILIGQDYRIKAINQRAADMILRIWDYTVEVGEFAPPLAKKFNLPNFEEEFKQALSGKLITGETFYPTGTEEDWFEFNYIPIKGSSGEVFAVCFSANNITERKKTEESLSSSMATNRALLDAMPDLLFRLNRKGVFLNYKAPNNSSLLVTPENFIGKSVVEVLPQIAGKTLEYVEKTLQTGKLQVFDYQLEINGFLRSFEARLVVSAVDEVMAIVRDITEQRLAEEALQYRFKFEQLLATISTRFVDVGANEIDQEIHQALAAMGRFSKADRIYIFLFSEDGALVSNTYEWCWEGIEPQIHLLQNLPVVSIPWVVGHIQRLETIHLPNLDLIPEEAYSERVLLELQSIQSLIIVPMAFEKKPIGFLGIDAVKTPKTWTADDIALLRIVSETFTSAIKRKITEQTLVEQRDFAQLVMNTMGQGLTVLSPDGYFQFVNPAYARMLGYQPEELLGKSPAELIPPEDQLIQAKAFSRRSLGESSTYENRILHRNGSTLYVSVTGVPMFRENQFKGVIAAITDITGRKLGEEALRESEHRLQTVVSNVPLMLFALDNRGVVTFAEGRGFQELAVEPAKFIGQSLPEAYPAIIEKLQRTLNGEFVNTLLTLDGKAYEFWLSPIKEKERVSGVIGVALDVSERLRAEEEIRQALEKEKELSNLKYRFISMASHDFRTPLTAILSSAELLENYGHRWTEERRSDMFRRIYLSVQNMTELLDEILFITKSEAGKLDFKPTLFDLSDFCGLLIEEIQLGPGIDHRFDLKIPPSPKQVWADEKLLRKALTNLLTNAVKYSSPGSIVYFELGYRAEEVVLVIRDEGIGIPVEGLNHLYEVFYRAGNVGNIKGTGLGLAIVKKSLETHKGKIEIESVAGSGTTCTLTIPVVQESGVELGD